MVRALPLSIWGLKVLSIAPPNRRSPKSGLSPTIKHLGPQGSEHRHPQIAIRQSLAPPNHCSPKSSLSPAIKHLGSQHAEHRHPQITTRQNLVRALPLSIWGLSILSIGSPKSLVATEYELSLLKQSFDGS
ncbi:hypothetical protein VNO80_27086 [Phaseolus coccineus]|uniref:Uncharacterized protein n=1 Tax=Phaseolus coccineus TaxID=3886 RepID=A0AAN9LJP0_PHACN